MIVGHWFEIIPLVMILAPILVGFLWVRPDANRHGQPGVLWAIVTIPLGWLAVLAYLVTRQVRQG